ncbi:hypothetical protein GGR60_000421 [Xanthomonas arboricola]|uniref:Uncharacterized protein n=3 Tax=Xanthomonas euroxanthea TaxID=2259622 RepID=A0A8E4G5T3_9XANT|nr:MULTISPECIES: hypothetical protein [Xanthomonas]MBB5769298.1 hypothetical protein [Xanthomonas euroxanthea]NIK37742.1 hypothetical protein [Xanthomonas euroxanthea]NJC35931.1 hypothetical protein [Xanthomonas euroxanthea]CAD1791472.1 hypothetical protein XSP_001972 [Xanthomonas sp. CPBF 426]CAD1791618.1 hypothetical protein XSP_002019 [Xanthomonas euroxanthea]
MSGSTRSVFILVVIAGLFAAAALYVAHGAQTSGSTMPGVARSSGEDRPMVKSISPNGNANGQWDASDFSELSASDQSFTAGNVVSHLNGFFSRLYSDRTMTLAERDAFAYRLALALESDKNTRKAVSEYYRQIPADKAMRRDIMRNMLAVGPVGRAVMLDEAKRIWDSKDKESYQHMYETYSGFPGQAPKPVIVDAIAGLSTHGIGSGTAVASLNLIGTLEKDDSLDAAQLRKAAVSQMSSLVSNDQDKSVRGIAAQKIYQLSSPEDAANLAAGFIRKDGANPWMVDQTLYSVSSGDVELTPALRSALASAVARGSLPAAAVAHYNAVVSQGP